MAATENARSTTPKRHSHAAADIPLKSSDSLEEFGACRRAIGIPRKSHMAQTVRCLGAWLLSTRPPPPFGPIAGLCWQCESQELPGLLRSMTLAPMPEEFPAQYCQ